MMTSMEEIRRATEALRLELPPAVAEDYIPRIDALIDVAQRQRMALEKYGRHKPFCEGDYSDRCACGLNAALVGV